MRHRPRSAERREQRGAVAHGGGSSGGVEIEIALLGDFELRSAEGAPLSISVRKAEALLAMLALRPGRPLGRDAVCGLLWPEVPDAQARHSLRQTLLCLRKALPPSARPLLRADARMLSLDPERLRVDAALLELRIESGTREDLLEAAALYRGNLLEGLSIDEVPFEHWLSFERERLRGLMVGALSRLFDLLENGDDIDAAISASTQLLKLDPLREDAHRNLMRLHARNGQRAAALQQYHVLVRALRSELGVDPEEETRRLYAELESGAGTPRARPASIATEPKAARPELAALIGRAPEAAHLHAALAHMRAGKPGLSLVLGEAGIGKTHLCEHFAAEASAAGVRVVRGRCFESEKVVPFSLWASVLQEACVLEDEPLLAELPAALRSELSTLLPALAAKAGHHVAQARDVLRLFQAMQQLVAGLSQRGPLLLWLEDLHWSDEMSLRLLCHLSRPQSGVRPCLILGTAREEDIAAGSFLSACVAELEREQLLQRLVLLPLSQADSCQLARNLARGHALERESGAWVERVWSLSEGNPFVIVECVRALAQGASDDDDVSGMPVPERIRAVILGRVGRTSPAARELLSLAAVVGREVDAGLLRHAPFEQTALVAALEELCAAQLLRASGDRFSFTHDRIRETLYAEMLPARRRLLHGAVASAIEQHCGQRLEAVLGPLGFHQSKAGNAEVAVPYLVRFAALAFRAHGVGEALAALEQAAVDAERLAEEQRARTAIEIVLHQALCLAFVGRFVDLVDRLRQQQGRLAALADPRLEGPFHFWWGFALALLGDLRAAEQQANHALARAELCADRRITAFARGLLSYLCVFGGRFELGVRYGRTAVELLRDIEDMPEVRGIVWLNLALNHLMRGDWQEALGATRRAEAIGQAADSLRLQAMAASTTGYVLAHVEQWELALEAGNKALSLAREPFTLVQAATLLGWAQSGCGQTAEAVLLLQQVVGQLELHGMRGWSVQARVCLARALLHAGEHAQAEPVAAQALEIARAIGDRMGTGHGLYLLGRCARALGQRELARERLDEALQLYESCDARIYIGHVLVALAELASSESDRAAARARLERARSLFASQDAERVLARVTVLSARCEGDESSLLTLR